MKQRSISRESLLGCCIEQHAALLSCNIQASEILLHNILGGGRHVKFCSCMHKTWIHAVPLNSAWFLYLRKSLYCQTLNLKLLWKRLQKWGILVSRAVPVNLIISDPGAVIKSIWEMICQFAKFLSKREFEDVCFSNYTLSCSFKRTRNWSQTWS